MDMVVRSENWLLFCADFHFARQKRWKELVERKYVSSWGYFLDDFRAFGINADRWTTAAQDEGGWGRIAEVGGGTFHGEIERCR